MITAVEKGRKLVITLGDGDDDNLVITVPPVNTATGAALFALWAGIVFAQSEQPEVDATNMSKIAVGEDNWPIVEDLRSAESTVVINAALFWNTQGGGIELVQEMLREGLPKARMSLAEANGLGTELSQLQTWLDGVSASQTLSPVATPDTSTPVGTGGSFGKVSVPQSSPQPDKD
jgi:hypothetical protein